VREKVKDWIGSLLVKAGILPDDPAPEPPKPKEGPQMDPNGGPH
jgi:hypothetical protein